MKNILVIAILFLISSTSFSQEMLTGDWDGKRTKWEESGIDFELAYIADSFKVVSGGVRQKSEYLGNLDLAASFDGEKLFNHVGASYFLYLLGDHGHNKSGGLSQHAGDLQGVSNIDTPDSFKIYEAWYQQIFASEKASLKFGLYDLNSEFDAMETAGLFINSSFGIGPDYSQSGQNGPSIFPTTSLALRLSYKFSDQYYAQVAILDGVPGVLDNEKGTHIRFDSGDGALYATELGYSQGHEDDSKSLYAKWALGMWFYSSSFDDLIDVDVNSNPVQRKSNSGIYVLGEYQFYRETNDAAQGASVFARYGIANEDINQIGRYFGAGIVYTGVLSGRNEDQLGLAIAIAYNGDKFKQQQLNNATPVDESETAIELSYLIKILPWLTIQPDIQWVQNPNMDPLLDDALLIGLRTEITF